MVFITDEGGNRIRTGTTHHSVICLTQRGSTKTVMYMCEPKFVPVDAHGKPSAPPLPTTETVLLLLRKHFGQNVVLHTDGAEAYEAACKMLKSEGFTVVHDSVIHSKGQFTAFGRHAVAEDGWESCELVSRNPKGELRIRVVKGTQKAEGLWRHLKHGNTGVPLEVHNDDSRLDMYVQSLAWSLQTCSCPYRDTLRMCRAFRKLPMEKKSYVFKYGLQDDAARTKSSKGRESGKRSRRVRKAVAQRKTNHDKPPVIYCKWHIRAFDEEDCESDVSDV